MCTHNQGWWRLDGREVPHPSLSARVVVDGISGHENVESYLLSSTPISVKISPVLANKINHLGDEMSLAVLQTKVVVSKYSGISQLHVLLGVLPSLSLSMHVY